MSVRFPSLHFPSPTPIRGRSCFVHVKQEGILEVLRATGIQHFLVPLPVLSDKIFHLLNHAVQAHVCARKVLQNAQGDFKHLQGTDKVPEPIILAGLVLWVLMFWAACIATTTKAIIYPADLEGVPPTWAYLHTHTHSHTYTDTHTHTHTHSAAWTSASSPSHCLICWGFFSRSPSLSNAWFWHPDWRMASPGRGQGLECAHKTDLSMPSAFGDQDRKHLTSSQGLPTLVPGPPWNL